MGEDAGFGQEHVQLEDGDGELGCAHGLELFFEGEGDIFVPGLEAETVAGYPLTFFDEVWFEGFLDVPGRDEVERLFGFEIAQGEELHSVADEGRFEFVFDEALA